MYLAWRPDDLSADRFAALLVDTVGPAMAAAGALAVQVNVADDAVADGAGHRRSSLAAPVEAVVSAWVPSAVAHLRAPVEAAFLDAGVTVTGYLVSESVPLDPPGPAVAGERQPGYTQVALLQRPAHLDADAWRSRWQDHHTEVAIRTQSTTAYRQNLVVHALHDDAPPIVAIVEETFPIEALTDPYVFFDAVGDDARFSAHIDAMVASTSTFIDAEGGLDVLVTSEHPIRVLDGVSPGR